MPNTELARIIAEAQGHATITEADYASADAAVAHLAQETERLRELRSAIAAESGSLLAAAGALVGHRDPFGRLSDSRRALNELAALWNNVYALGRSRKNAENPFRDSNLYGGVF